MKKRNPDSNSPWMGLKNYQLRGNKTPIIFLWVGLILVALAVGLGLLYFLDEISTIKGDLLTLSEDSRLPVEADSVDSTEVITPETIQNLQVFLEYPYQVLIDSLDAFEIVVTIKEDSIPVAGEKVQLKFIDPSDRSPLMRVTDAQGKAIFIVEDLENLREFLSTQVVVRDDSYDLNIRLICLDTDSDGLTNDQESILKTDPEKQDSDDDGITDFFELMVFNSDPRKNNWVALNASAENPINFYVFPIAEDSSILLNKKQEFFVLDENQTYVLGFIDVYILQNAVQSGTEKIYAEQLLFQSGILTGIYKEETSIGKTLLDISPSDYDLLEKKPGELLLHIRIFGAISREDFETLDQNLVGDN